MELHRPSVDANRRSVELYRPSVEGNRRLVERYGTSVEVYKAPKKALLSSSEINSG